MPQGKMKVKARKPAGVKQKGQRPKKVLGPKKGGRPIAPKKERHMEAAAFKRNLSKALNSKNEHQVTTQAARSEHTNMRILKPEAAK